MVVTGVHATGTPEEALQDLAEHTIRALVDHGDLSPMSDVERISEILTQRGLSPEAVKRWWDTPLLGLGMRVPLVMVRIDPQRVADIARTVELPKTRRATREAEDATKRQSLLDAARGTLTRMIIARDRRT